MLKDIFKNKIKACFNIAWSEGQCACLSQAPPWDLTQLLLRQISPRAQSDLVEQDGSNARLGNAC